MMIPITTDLAGYADFWFKIVLIVLGSLATVTVVFVLLAVALIVKLHHLEVLLQTLVTLVGRS